MITKLLTVFYHSSSEQVYLVSAILRTITQVLESEASLNKSSILYAPVQARSSPGTVKEVDVINEVKIEISNDVDHIDEENFVVEGEKKNAEEHQDNSREPGEISDKKSVTDWPEEENDKEITAIPNENQKTHLVKNESANERILSVTEQNYIKSSLDESRQLIYEQSTLESKSLTCQFCSFITNRKVKRYQRQELKRHYADVHCICKLCGNIHTTKSNLRLHLRVTHIQGCKTFVCGIEECGHKENIFLDSGRLKIKFDHLYTHIQKQHCSNPISNDERMLSVTEQNYIKYSLSEYHQPISEQPTSKSKSLICQFCSYSTKRKEKRDRIKELKRHYEDVHFICKLCGDFQVTKPSLMNHLKATHIQGSGYFLCGIDGCGHKEKVFRKNGRMKFKFNALYAHIRKQH